MSEKEKQMIEKISKLPAKVQDRFADQIDGAVKAVEVLAAGNERDRTEVR